jgi:hypothetical protein
MSTATLSRIFDASGFFIALTMRDLSRGKATLGSSDLTAWRLYFLLAVLMIGFAFAHILALQRLNATRSERPATIDSLTD